MRLDRAWKVWGIGFPPWKGSFKVKVWIFWIGFARLGLKVSPLARFERLGLKVSPLAREVLALKFGASGDGLEG